MSFRFENTYASLPSAFFEPVDPTAVSSPELIAFNRELAEEMGLIENENTLEVFAGNLIPKGAEPIAMAYSGHQFAGFSPQLGDGRAILLGEVVGRDGIRRDIQLKGAGPTPFSRRGDGRSALGPVLREYLVSEAMAALGIPTTRALAAVSSGEKVFRDRVEPGGVFTRVAQSHLRIGTVQYFAARQDIENLKILVDYAVARHYPESKDSENPALALLEGVMRRQAGLVAKWMGVGFIHGVMNTDNMSLSGETIDYGPCAFMDHYDPARKFSYIDRRGRYAFGNQPGITHWNLTRLAEALLPVLAAREEDAMALAESILETFPGVFEAEYIRKFREKTGISDGGEKAWPIAQDFLDLVADQKVDFTLAYRHLSRVLENPDSPSLINLFPKKEPISQWIERWRTCLEKHHISKREAIQLMRQANPVYIPRNHRIEEIIEAGKQGDFEPFHRLHEVLQKPFEERAGCEDYELAPEPHEIVPATFCGT